MNDRRNPLYELEYFIHGKVDEDTNELDHINVVSTDQTSRLILNEFKIRKDVSPLLFDEQNHNGRYSLSTFEKEGELERIAKTIKNLDELKNSLDVNSTFGVMGLQQQSLFAEVFPNLVDVSEYLIDALTSDESVIDSVLDTPPLTIGKLFINFLTPLKIRYEYKPPESREQEKQLLKLWIERKAWPDLLFMPNDIEDDVYSSDEPEYMSSGDEEYGDGTTARHNKLKKDAELRCRRW